MTMAAVAAGIGAAGAIGAAGMQMGSAKSAGNAARKQINKSFGYSTRETQQQDKQAAKMFRPVINQVATYQGRLNDELLKGSLAKSYGWDQYKKDSGLSKSATQQDFLRKYTAQDFGQAIGDKNFSLASLFKSMTPADFKARYGYDLKNAGIEYNPEAFKREFGRDTKDIGKEYSAADFLDTYGYDIKDALQEFRGENLQNDPGYQFRLSQGLGANDKIAAARGGVLSGGQLKAQQRYAQDLAATEFDAAYDRDAQRKGMALGQFNTATQNDLNNRSMLANLYTTRYGQDAQNRQAMMNQWTSDFSQNQADLLRKQGLYQGEADNDFRAKQAQLDNYYRAIGANNVQRAQKYDQLKGMYDTGLQAMYGLANSRQNNSMARINAASGSATQASQNAWNQAGASNSALAGLTGNLSQLAGIYAANSGGFGGLFGSSPTSKANSGMDAIANSAQDSYSKLFRR